MGTITMASEEYDAMVAERDRLRVENERLKESLKVIMDEDLKSAGLRQQEGEIKTLRKALDEARELLE